MADPDKNVDKGWAWMVLLSAFFINIISLGVLFSSGIFYLIFLEELHEDYSAITWIPALATGMTFLTGPIAGFLLDKFGFRVVLIFGSLLSTSGFIWSTVADSVYTLYITFGILIGFGCGLCYLPGITMVAVYFKEKKYFAMAFSSAGTGLTSLIFPPFQYYLIETYGYRGALLLNAGVTLQMAVCGSLARPMAKPAPSINRIEEQSKYGQGELFKNKYFYISALHIFLLHGYYIFVIHLNKFLVDRGISAQDSAFLSAMFGLGNLVGRISVSLMGLSAKFKKTGSHILINISTFAQGILFICFILPDTFTSFAILGVFAGIMFGIKIGLIFPVIAELFPSRLLNANFGYTLFSSGLALIIGPHLAGWCNRQTSSLSSGIILSGGFVLLSGLLMLWLSYGLYHKQKETQKRKLEVESIALKKKIKEENMA